ncbi:glutamyl-tRNA reductase [Sanguibacter gelidistatuariae]|uniref:Glutamyl-tRNA reductase n=1 Tax=Sanguibacter gelidistatuariae TaxID=1814289 RepID=A0A1G6H8A8_9MICO|nr:glutamyl-tRNA reductase [Sanguibacter gelidistatuariae]SDB90500.1 glutamyl-tRNA reductase [Sanguibacter gelidistatuariae]
MSLTASHHELDLEALEQLSSGAHSMGTSAVQACEMITGAVVLATCNRFELYLDVADGAGRSATSTTMTERDLDHASGEVARLVAAASGVSVDAARSAFTVRSGPDVAAHLFSVASGLDSMVVGEREIAGQVRRALDAAHAARTTSARLERLFQGAARTSKKVSHQTHLGADGRSVVSVGLDLAEAIIPPWGQTRAVIVGTGAYAGASVAALRARGCADLSVYSASGRAEQFAQARGIDAVDDLVEALGDADLVVSCSGAGGGRAPREAGGDVRGSGVGTSGEDDSSALGYILQTAAVVTARERAAERVGEEMPERPLVILDLALHHDVDPQVGDIDHVLLMDLGTIRGHAPSTASEPVRVARSIVEDSVADFQDREALRAADQIIVALRERITAEVQAEIERSAPAFSSPADVTAHERSLRRLAGALLHRGIIRIREAARNGEALDDVAAETMTVVSFSGAVGGAATASTSGMERVRTAS